MSGKIQTVELTKDKDCKGSVRFATTDDKAPVSNVYISRQWAEIGAAQRVKVTVEIVGGAS